MSPHFQELVDLICDVKQMEEAVVEMQYDAKKAPLGNTIFSLAMLSSL